MTDAPAFTVRSHQVYDHRLRDLVFHTGDVAIARDCGVPRSTCNDWKNGKFRGVVSTDVFDRDAADLQAEVLKLRCKLRVCQALFVLLMALVQVFDLKLSEKRLPEGKHKQRLLRAMERARKVAAAQSRAHGALACRRRGITVGAEHK